MKGGGFRVARVGLYQEPAGADGLLAKPHQRKVVGLDALGAEGLLQKDEIHALLGLLVIENIVEQKL